MYPEPQGYSTQPDDFEVEDVEFVVVEFEVEFVVFDVDEFVVVEFE